MLIRRLSLLLPSLPEIGWLVVGWTMLANVSTARFTFSLFGPISKWLDGHPWAGFLVGFGLLIFAVIWPEIEGKIPDSIKFPKTTGSRLRAIEAEHIPLLNKNYLDIGKEIDALRTAIASEALKSSVLESGLNQALDLQNEFCEHITKFNEINSERISDISKEGIKAMEERSNLR